jgi:hypothetical protein
MRSSPSIVPHGADRDTYLVLNDFGRLGRAWCEADEEGTDRETLIHRFLADQFSHPVRIVAFNTAEAGRATSRSILPTSCVGAFPNSTRCRALCRSS